MKIMKTLRPALIVCLLLILAAHAGTAAMRPAELAEAPRWSAAKFQGLEAPFSFVYGGQASAELLKEWKLERTRESSTSTAGTGIP